MNPVTNPAEPEYGEIPTRRNPNSTSILGSCVHADPAFMDATAPPHEPAEQHAAPADDFLPQLWSSNHTATHKIPETISEFDQSHYGRVIAPNVSFSTNVLTETTVPHRAIILCVPILAFAATTAAPPPAARPVRATGVIRAVHSVTVLVPFIEGQGGNLALATLAENGALVNAGDSLATFDRATELRLLRDAQTKFEDLARQIEEKKAEHISNAE